jgi:hypothetical protein
MSQYLSTAASLAIALLLVSTALRADEAEPRTQGELLYEIYCSSCHGKSGKGNGPMASILRVKPTNLRLITARHDGLFPVEEIHRTIDGRRTVLGHGSREMPLWGLAFQVTELDANQEQEVRAKIVALIEYLKSLQEPLQEAGKEKAGGRQPG